MATSSAMHRYRARKRTVPACTSPRNSWRAPMTSTETSLMRCSCCGVPTCRSCCCCCCWGRAASCRAPARPGAPPDGVGECDDECERGVSSDRSRVRVLSADPRRWRRRRHRTAPRCAVAPAAATGAAAAQRWVQRSAVPTAAGTGTRPPRQRRATAGRSGPAPRRTPAAAAVRLRGGWQTRGRPAPPRRRRRRAATPRRRTKGRSGRGAPTATYAA
eukprot:181306-Chlamydomonas_euryale.AAC.1